MVTWLTESFTIAIMILLSITEYLCHRWPLYVLFVVVTILPSFPLYHRICNRSSTTEANSRAGTITYLHISTSVLWCPLRFPSKTMFGLPFFLFNLLFMLLYLFTYTCVHHVRWYSCHLMGVTSGAWTAYLPGAREFTPGFVLFNLCGVDHCTHVFRPFCFGHCMICSRSSWYLLLYSRVTSKVMIQLIVKGPSPILSYI